jgi:hypothetical protein
MESLKKHGDPLEDELKSQDDELRKKTVRGADVVSDNDPGSKGDVRSDGELVRSANQTPNPNQKSNDATMEPGGDLGQKRNSM